MSGQIVSRILSIVFNPNGTRCVTTDNNGVVGVWKTDQRGLCNQSLWQTKIHGRVRENKIHPLKTKSLLWEKWRLRNDFQIWVSAYFQGRLLLVLGSVKVG